MFKIRKNGLYNSNIVYTLLGKYKDLNIFRILDEITWDI